VMRESHCSMEEGLYWYTPERRNPTAKPPAHGAAHALLSVGIIDEVEDVVVLLTRGMVSGRI
jgi:hypothetical protein